MTTQPWPPPPNNTPEWYKQAWFTILTLFFCFPIGLALMWIYQKKWHVAIKSIISGFFALVIIGSASDNSSKPASPPTQTASAVVVPFTPAQKRKQQAVKVAKEQAAKAKIVAQHQKEEDAKVAAQAKRQEENERKQAEEA